MKKTISICLIFTMIYLFSFQATVNAQATVGNNEILYNENSIVITLVEKNHMYQKIKIEDKNENKIEYAESYLKEDGSYIYKATTRDDIYTIEKVDNEILVTDKNDSIIERIPLNNIDNSFDEEITILPNEQENIENDRLSYCIPDGPWNATHMKGETSRKTELTDLGAVIGIAASILGAPVDAGIAITLGTLIYSKLITEVFYYYEIQHRFKDGWLEKRQYTKVYTDSSYNSIEETFYSPGVRYNYVGTPCD